ncbi:hypothetical protein AC249_AIPGENE28540 [Exaiptasia diaphana]|nr:hypothetical protein AC249_AIPGENE28540 [Exaiptasia diaphana]
MPDTQEKKPVTALEYLKKIAENRDMARITESCIVESIVVDGKEVKEMNKYTTASSGDRLHDKIIPAL